MALQAEAKKFIINVCEEYKNKQTPLMMILSEVQKKYGYIPKEAQELISEITGIPVAEIYGVVTFYSFFSLNPKGKYVIGVCLGTACYVRGSQNIIDNFCNILKIKPGQTTEDGLFTIDALRCIGACALAPAVRVNDIVYPRCTVADCELIIHEIREKEGLENGTN